MYHELKYEIVIGKAEWLRDKANPRFIVTSLKRNGEERFERVYCARVEMENRIKEQQQDLFADRRSSAGFAANQLRLWLSAFASQLVERLRPQALKGTALAQTTVGTLRLKRFKRAARVEVSFLRIRHIEIILFPRMSGCLSLAKATNPARLSPASAPTPLRASDRSRVKLLPT